jgi:hypothetical protein
LRELDAKVGADFHEPAGDVAAADDQDLVDVLRFEDAAEDAGRLPADARETCHSCKAWATPEHVAGQEHAALVFSV